jgi:hypothetical protein
MGFSTIVNSIVDRQGAIQRQRVAVVIFPAALQKNSKLAG